MAKRAAAYALLTTFTLLLVRKLDQGFSGSWWRVFAPLWLFHALVARGRFSIPAPSHPYYSHLPPLHELVATPLLFAFEVLLCTYYLESSSSGLNLKIVFLPIVLLEVIIIIDNVRMCFALRQEEVRHPSESFTREKMTHCWIILSMTFILGATMFMLLMLIGVTDSVNWWGPYSVYSVGQCFAFLVFTKWNFPQSRVCSSSSISRTPGLNVNPQVEEKEDKKLGRLCSLQNMGGHVIKAAIVAFQVLLCMRLQGTPGRAREIPFRVIFSPLFLLLGVGILASTLQMLERFVILHLLSIEASTTGRYFMFSSRVYDFLELMLHGSRLLGWWSTDEGSRQVEARMLYDPKSGRYTFCENPLDVVKKMSRRDLLEEVWMLQLALIEQIKTTKACKRYELYLKEMPMCSRCSKREIDVVLLPCEHWTLCRGRCLDAYFNLRCSMIRMYCPECDEYFSSVQIVYSA